MGARYRPSLSGTASRTTLLDPRKALDGKVPEAFFTVTGGPLTADPKLRELAKNSEPLEFRLYRGATPKDPVCGMYSFFPALPAGSKLGFPAAANCWSRATQFSQLADTRRAREKTYSQGNAPPVGVTRCSGPQRRSRPRNSGRVCRDPRLLDFLGSLYPDLLRVAGVSRANHRARLAALK